MAKRGGRSTRSLDNEKVDEAPDEDASASESAPETSERDTKPSIPVPALAEPIKLSEREFTAVQYFRARRGKPMVQAFLHCEGLRKIRKFTATQWQAEYDAFLKAPR